jgi:hypothetical protein
MLAPTEPDLDAYLSRTAANELVWVLNGVTYEARDQGETLTLRRQHRALVLTMTPDSTFVVRASLSSSDAPEPERDKWEQLMALVETHAI